MSAPPSPTASCDETSYSASIELLKYIIQFSYMIPTLILDILIIKAICFSERTKFGSNAFFLLFALETALLWTEKLWMCIALSLLLPLTVTWNLIISKAFLDVHFGGLSINYQRAVSWASLSLFMLVLCIISLVILISSTVATLIGISSLEVRLKSSEKNLCIVAVVMAFGIILFGLVRSAFMIPSISQGPYKNYLLALQYIVSDFCTASSPLIIIYMSTALREAMIQKREIPENVPNVVTVHSNQSN
ncbi:unnamed protein product [Caenorhabditis auriculariae]|uniref:Serpentine receptor class gamma n=1 Tax=Caenorhabditis auriculariae TaxID=2777116 RepID=A0A8S1HQN3_9PELO|nr:unnamed protein product [Caenorhabditis auriculariae]